MNMYEKILAIVDQKGPVSISSIRDEMNQQLKIKENGENLIQISQVKSALTRKKDLFNVTGDIVSIHPDKELVSFSLNIGGHPGPSFKVDVNFHSNDFRFFELYLSETMPSNAERSLLLGSVEEFKQHLYTLKVWDWKKDYQPEHVVLDGSSWSIKVTTKGKVYESEGIEAYPPEWKKLRLALSNLIGKNLF